MMKNDWFPLVSGPLAEDILLTLATDICDKWCLSTLKMVIRGVVAASAGSQLDWL